MTNNVNIYSSRSSVYAREELVVTGNGNDVQAA